MAGREPLELRRLDLAGGDAGAEPSADGRFVRLTVWWRDVPLAATEVNDRGLPPRALADRVAHLMARPVGDRLLGRGFDLHDPGAGIVSAEDVPDLDALLALESPLERLDAALPPAGAAGGVLDDVTLIVCTRDRPDQLERCLASVRRASPAPAEVIVVDNAPSAATRDTVARVPGVRYLPEPRPGLSVARNTGVAAARGELLAFVDDDTEVEPAWLGRLCAPFTDPEVMATTGLVLPAALDTPSQLGFEKVLGGFARGFQPLAYGPGFFARTRRLATPVWRVGAGANMAVRAEALRRVGPFDERLGAGASGCSEDSELWYRLLAGGWTCLYDPTSVVLHHHRPTRAGLRRQAHEYMRGHVAALFVQYGRHHNRGDLRRAFGQLPRFLVSQIIREAARRTMWALRLAPPQLPRPAAAELAGYLRGLRYLPAAMAPPERPSRKAALREFLAGNPFPHPFTEGFFYREKMRAIHRVSPDVAPRDVLEVGGGQSGLARMLYPGAHVTVLDADPAYADSPVNRHPDITFVHGDATRLPFDDASFDVVTFLDVLEHIADDAVAVAEARRVVRPGGHILVSSPNERWRSPYHRVMRPICPTDEDMIERWGHVRRGYTIEDYTRIFGAPPDVRADFINRVTVVNHDLAFSRLPDRVRRRLLGALSPVTWLGYWLQPRGARGTETAAAWRVPAA